jgi:hypothetical protein
MPGSERADVRTILLSGAAAGVACAIAIYATYPGWLSFDSALQLWQARRGLFTNVQPPFGAVVWSVLLRMRLQPGALLVMHVCALCAGLGLLAAAVRADLRWPALMVPMLVLWPPFLLVIAHVWIDVGLAAALVLGFGLLAHAQARESATFAWIALAPLFYAAAVRHNGLAALPPALWLWASLVAQPNASRVRRFAIAFLALALVGFSAHTVNRLLATEQMTVWAPTAIWDLAAASVASDRMLLPAGVRSPELSVAELRGALDHDRALTLLVGTRSGINAGLISPIPEPDRTELFRSWLLLPWMEPRAWAEHRLAVAWSLFGPQRAAKPMEMFMAAGVVDFRDNPHIAANDSGLNRALIAFGRAWRTSLLCTPLIYLALGILGMALAPRLAPAQCELIVAIAVSGLLYAAPLIVVAPSAEYRYAFWPMLSGALALLLALSAQPRSA